MNDTAIQSESADTREKILDAAERLFIEHGFAATSLRAIASGAAVNLAAPNYHFGSKKDLLAAVFHRRVQPINEQRLLLLKELKESKRALTTRSILTAFFTPLTRIAPGAPALVGRVMSEPEALIKPIMEEEFSRVATSFQDALMNVLPQVPPEELRWRFHFIVGSMIHILHIQTPIGVEPEYHSFAEGMRRLIDFSAAGLEQVNSE